MIKPYIPDTLPLSNIRYEPFVTHIGNANAELARYDALLKGIPNPQIMLSPLTDQEATLSSKIEGTQATVREVLEHEAGMIKEGKQQDIQEIINYINALKEASQHLENHSITLVLIRRLHKILMSSIRGKNKDPGEFRNGQNWIGPIGCSLEKATFVPPSHLTLPSNLEQWLCYLDGEDKDVLVQTAIVHAQFELIHPFADGNGRIGRILIPLFLYQKKKLFQPMFYLSEYLESHRKNYYAKLNAISAKGDWEGWIVFFLEAIIKQAQTNSQRVSKIMELYKDMKRKIHDLTHSQFSLYLLDAIFQEPIFKSSDMVTRFEKQFKINRSTTLGLIKKLKQANILQEIQPRRGRRSAVLCFIELILTAEEGIVD